MLATYNVSVDFDFPVTVDDSTLTLRDAIAYINGDFQPGPTDIAAGAITGTPGVNDTIRFLPSASTQPIVLNQGSLTLRKPAIIDGSTVNGDVILSGGNSLTQSGITYEGDGTGRRLDISNLEFVNFAVGGGVVVQSLGNGDIIDISSSKFTGIGRATSSFDTAAIDIRDNFKGGGFLLVEGNEIYYNDIGVKYNNVTGSSSSVSNFGRIGGNQFKDPGGTIGNVLQSIVLGKDSRNIIVDDNDFYLNYSSEVAVEIDNPPSPGNTSNTFIVVTGSNTFEVGTAPQPGDVPAFITDNRGVQAPAPDLREGGSTVSGSEWSVEFVQESFFFSSTSDVDVEFYRYNSANNRWSRTTTQNIASTSFQPDGFVFQSKAFLASQLAQGDFLTAIAVDENTNRGSSVFAPIIEIQDFAPRITDVQLRGSAWSSSATSHSFADAVFAGEQLQSLPFSGIDTIDLFFTEDLIPTANAITITGSNGTVTPTTVQVNPDGDFTTNDYRWILDPADVLTGDKYRIDIVSTAIRDPQFNFLDGEWTNPTSPDDLTDDQQGIEFITGDRQDRGDFRFHFAVLPGDYNGDGVVEASEGIILDGDGDGDIGDPDDIQLPINNDGESLPLQATDADYFDDEKVNAPDLDLWQIAFGSQVGDPLYDPRVDPDGNGIVDGGDFLVWQRQFGKFSAWYTPLDALAAITIGAAPQVSNVVISGSLSQHAPFSFDSVDGSGLQLQTVPVGGADTISISFSEDVNVSANHLFLVGLMTSNLPALINFSYDPATFTASWQFDSWEMGDQYVISLSDFVTDADGNNLDGEWTNPASINTTNSAVSTFPSGDGQSGGRFNFVTTLLADMNGDNIVNYTDYYSTYYRWYLGVTANGFESTDFNGDGVIDGDDFQAVQENMWLDLQDIGILADLDADGDVDATDLDTIVGNAGLTNATYADGDLNGDGTVNITDLDLAYAQFGLALSLVS